MPVDVDAYHSIRAAVTVQPGDHGHGIHVPAGGVGQCPVEACAVAVDFDLAGLMVLEPFGEPLHVSVQAAVPDKEPEALFVAIAEGRGINIVTDLIAGE